MMWVMLEWDVGGIWVVGVMGVMGPLMDEDEDEDQDETSG